MFYIKEKLLIAVLSVIILGNLYDFVTDFGHGASVLHLLEEAAVIVVSGALILWLLADLRRQRRELGQLRLELAAHRNPATAPPPAVAEARRQLGGLIQAQFRDWGLTDSEQEVGLLLLKGLSFKEIAALRLTQEKTVRAQASGIYRKSGVTGRHAFAAWFIEDFL
ncbi:MAG TPA: DNA-binding response regulator [Gammaproteobacteria bacterium]|nr:DNA-binding response regulator [Gammaproteobacteria bacterium]